MAINLRPAIFSFAPLLGTIRSDLELSEASAGLLTTIPVALMGLSTPVAVLLGKRWGKERVVAAAVILIGISIAVRLSGSAIGIFTSVVGAGIGIAAVQTLLPSIVKNRFTGREELVTGFYATGIGAGSALATAATKPLTELFGGYPPGDTPKGSKVI